MENFIANVPMEHRILTPEDGAQYFFGYYDMRADDGTGRHLCHRVSFADRVPAETDVAELGYLQDRRFFPFAITTAWNFQQGAMLEYHPSEKNTVFFNTVKDGALATAILNFETGAGRCAGRRTSSYCPYPHWGVSV